MKTLEELGIGPAPWRCVCYKYKHDHLGEIRFADNQILCLDINQPDAQLAAAAPEMYEALRCSTNFIEHAVQFVENEDIKNALREIADKNKSALAKASGESEVVK